MGNDSEWTKLARQLTREQLAMATEGPNLELAKTLDAPQIVLAVLAQMFAAASHTVLQAAEEGRIDSIDMQDAIAERNKIWGHFLAALATTGKTS